MLSIGFAVDQLQVPQYIYCYRERVNKDVSGAQKTPRIMDPRNRKVKVLQPPWGAPAFMLSCSGATEYSMHSIGSTRRSGHWDDLCCLFCISKMARQINMPRYSDIQSWIGGIVEIMFFLDFLNYRFPSWNRLRVDKFSSHKLQWRCHISGLLAIAFCVPSFSKWTRRSTKSATRPRIWQSWQPLLHTLRQTRQLNHAVWHLAKSSILWEVLWDV